MRYPLPAACLLLATVLMGCTRKPPVIQHDPELTIPGSWQSWEAVQPAPVADAWWLEFGDPGLQEAIDRALVHNRDLRVTAARLEAAGVEARIAGAPLKPAVAASLVGNRRRQNFIGFPIPGGAERVLATSFTTLGVSLNVSWEADLWGGISAGKIAALARAEAAEAALYASRLSLAGQVAKAWFGLGETSNQIALAQSTIDSYRRSAEWIRLRYETGLRPSLDLRLALSNQASAEALLQQRLVQRDTLIRQLETLLGAYPGGTLTPPEKLPSLPDVVPTGLPAELLGRRPDLLAAERQVLAADALIAQNRAALYPRLSLTGTAGTSSRALADLLDGDFGVWSLIGDLAQPVFQGGRLRNNLELSRTRAEEALHSWAGQVLRALAEVETALAAEGLLQRQLASLEESSIQIRAALQLAEERYRRGVGGVLAVLESQRRLLETETQHLTLQRLRLDNRVDLYLALGGGFPGLEFDLPPSHFVTLSEDRVQP